MVTRNTEVVAEEGTFEIFIGVTENTWQNQLASGYTSYLVAGGYLPGVYEYTASNRAMTANSTANFTIEGISSLPLALQAIA